MRASAEYLAQASECVRRAERAKSANHRRILLDEAQTWLRIATEAELITKKLQTIETSTAS